MKPDAEVGAQVELNPKLLSAILGEDEGIVQGVINRLCDPDEISTSKAEDGRRLVRLGQFAYRVVNGAHYMAIRNEDERREYFRDRKREERVRKGKGKAVFSGSIRTQVNKAVREDSITKADKAALKGLVREKAGVAVASASVAAEYDLTDVGDLVNKAAAAPAAGVVWVKSVAQAVPREPGPPAPEVTISLEGGGV